MASAVGIIMWVSFGVFSAPDTYMIPAQAGVEEPEEDLTPSGPTYPIEILAESAIEGNPDYAPDRAVVTQGHIVKWENVDSAAHTVTSTEGTGEIFDSSLVSAGETYSLDTTDLEVREYEYFCFVHPWMIATLIIEAAPEPVTISIPEGSGAPGCEETDECYLPFEVTIDAGTVVSWSNDDTAAHTVTSGLVAEGGDGIFDSSLFAAGTTFEVTFNDAGTFDYFCQVHPWMVGIVNVE